MTNLPFTGKFYITQHKSSSHPAVDIVGLNTTVYSVCDGVVLDTTDLGDKSYGRYIRIRDSVTNKIFIFAHLSKFLVSAGARVTRATQIGIMGSTGNSTGPHLHIELRDSNYSNAASQDIEGYMGVAGLVPYQQYDSANFQIGGGTGNVPNITYQAHVQNIGWQNPVSNGGIAGTTGQDLRIEAIKISSDIDIQYRVHMEGIGWGEWVPKDCVAGTTGQNRRIEAIEIISSYNDFKGQAHVQYTGWMAEQVGTHITIGTTGQGLRLEAFKLQFLPK